MSADANLSPFLGGKNLTLDLNSFATCNIEKLSLFEKQNQWILTSNNQVVWVIGKRADNRFSSSLKSNKRMYISIELS